MKYGCRTTLKQTFNFCNSHIFKPPNKNTAHYMATTNTLSRLSSIEQRLTVASLIIDKIDFLISSPKVGYGIFHPFDGSINHNTQQVEFKHICNVDAQDLEDAFRKSQNDFNEDYASLDTRSTCIGDMFINYENMDIYIVDNIGFKELPFSWYTFINLDNHI